ncbi:MAG: FAD binding domain-containing protein [Eubacteriales bacterium]|nr:FAD binding domain-containing protein [Eubacteriales bacterium]
MLKIKDYVKAESLGQAYELNQKKANRIIGGMLWMKMSDAQIQTAIDLSGLGLDQIEETDEEFSIGCMTTLRQLELHEGLNTYTNGAVRESVRHIVGVQFRNLATIGGSIFGRYGFSDVLTCFMGLDAYVELYKGGIVTLEAFADMPKDNDILVRVIVKKKAQRCVYLSHRNTKTDFPVIACMVSLQENAGKVVIGARPGKAMALHLSGEQMKILNSADVSETCVKKIAEEISADVPTDSNIRASAQYRSHLIRVLVRRAIMQLVKEGGCE